MDTTEIIPPGLSDALGIHQKNMDVAFAALKGNPYRAEEQLTLMRKEIVSTLVTLMEAGIPVNPPKKSEV